VPLLSAIDSLLAGAGQVVITLAEPSEHTPVTAVTPAGGIANHQTFT
jgi:hypothetical protein